MHWVEAKRLRGIPVVDQTGERFGTLVGPYVMEGRLKGYEVEVEDHVRDVHDAGSWRVTLGAEHFDRVGDRLKLDLTSAEALRLPEVE